MVELMIGLIGILALAVGLLQLTTLTMTQTESMMRAREEAGQLAMEDNVQVLGAPDYIRDWREGPDGRRYSRDDTHNSGDPMAFSRTVVERAAPRAAWFRLGQVPAGALPDLRGEPMPASFFGLVKGDDTRTLPLLPAVQDLLYRADHIDIRSKVWMTSTRGLY